VTMTREAGEILARYLAGSGSPAMTLTALLIEAERPHEVAELLDLAMDGVPGDSPEQMRLDRLAALHAAHPQAYGRIRGVLAAVRHDAGGLDPGAAVARIAAMFDAAAAVSPEASVALYSLGDAEQLAAATAEVVARMRAWGPVMPGHSLLDIGCGIGRFEEAIAGEVKAAVGIDVSERMIAEARARCAGRANVSFHLGSGHALVMFADASFEGVFAVDSFPYLVQAGGDLAERAISEAARVLRPGGELLILNYSYRDDLDADRQDVARHGAAAGLTVERAGVGGFAIWNGSAFLLRKD
jgi:SAM-dependent methyltransferase